ncbi:penicillin-binding transpeptidase domain-containing protein [Dactylosporangium sp. NPDC005555]|uniref:penicillin-binding transpeptidase domain-containing protein n=1 Tax=Dactylosporangium sp. NPDC005555 TaxID=3154889 RepID=UPI0033AFF97D
MAGDTPDRRGSTERRGGAGREAGRSSDAGRQRTGGRAGAGGAGAAARSRGGTDPQTDPPVRGTMSEARRYTPRGRSVRDASVEHGGTGRGDPFRPALEVLQGGRTDTGRRAAGRAADSPRTPRDAAGRATDSPRTPRDAAGRATDSPRTPRDAAGRTTDSPRTPKQPRDAADRQPPRRQPGTQARTETGRQLRTQARAPQRAHRTATDVDGDPRTTRTRAPLKRATPARGTGRTPARKTTPVLKPRKQSRVRVPRLPRTTRAPKLAEPRRRLRLATVLALLMFGAIGIRLVQLQLTDASAYAAEGLKDRLAHEVLPAARGAILDRTGKILVHSVETRYVVADPMVIKNPEKTADQLFAILDRYGVTRSELVRKLTPHKGADGKTDIRFEYLAHQIDIEDGDRIKALGYGGALRVDRDERRHVPGYDLASNVIGYTSKADLSGQLGIEQTYDEKLRGVDGMYTYEHGEGDLDKPLPQGQLELRPARPGSSVELTIDADLTYSLQSALGAKMTALGASFGTAIVLDAKTSEVMAMASYPSFAAADPGKTPPEQIKDQCTATVFDPGSIHKAIVMGAALQEGLITPTSTVTVNSKVKKGDTTYTDHPPQKDGTAMTIPGILALSSNVGTIAVADMLGKDKLYEYQRKFGLGQRTGVGLPNESPGQLLPPNEWTGSSPGSIPIGNGVATTAIQMAVVYATIANDGLWVQPTLVRKIIAPDGTATKPPAQQTRRVMDPEHAQQLRTMLEGVTTLDDATGHQAAIPGYRIAGKTGTSKMPQDGGYAPGDVVSFIGMAPAEAPRYVVAVTAHVPGGAGGSVAAPLFKEFMALTLSNFGVVPTGTEAPKLTIYP